MTKITKKDNFKSIIAVLTEAGKDDLVAVMEHEIELLDKKSANRSTKPTNRQVENDAIKTQIVASLEPNRWYRCAEIKALVPELAEGEGTQRTARLCNDMADVNKDDKRLVRMVDKKVVYFALAE